MHGIYKIIGFVATIATNPGLRRFVVVDHFSSEENMPACEAAPRYDWSLGKGR